MNVCRISVEETWPVRNEILRPGLPLATCQFEEDSLPGATHFGSFAENELTGIVSVYQINPAHEAKADGWQFRAMATREHVRGEGHGKALIAAMEDFLLERDADLCWCNARESASDFYHKLGYTRHGEIYDIAGVGPHWLMQKRL